MAKGTVRKIDTQYFDTAIKELTDAISVYNDAKKNIDRATQSLQGSWDGKGAKKFDSAYKRLKRELDDQGENLVAMRDDLQSILETYQNWDTQNASQIGENEIDSSGTVTMGSGSGGNFSAGGGAGGGGGGMGGRGGENISAGGGGGGNFSAGGGDGGGGGGMGGR